MDRRIQSLRDVFSTPVRTLSAEEISKVSGADGTQPGLGAKPSLTKIDAAGRFR